MDKRDLNPGKDKKKKFARFGIGTKGAVYVLIGGLTAWAAFRGGGKKTGSDGAMEFLIKQPFGQVLLWIVVLGLLGYVFWRMYQTFADPEDKGTDAKGVARRIGYFSSGVFYCFLIYSAVSMLLGSSSGGGGGGKESMIQKLLNQEFGRWMVVGVALIFLGKALYQMFRAFSGQFKDKLKEAGLDEKTQKVMRITGRIGYTARGLVIGVIAFLITKAALSYDSSKAGGTKEAFSFVQNEFSSVILGFIALGLVAYGVFMMIKASEREMDF